MPVNGQNRGLVCCEGFRLDVFSQVSKSLVLGVLMPSGHPPILPPRFVTSRLGGQSWEELLKPKLRFCIAAPSSVRQRERLPPIDRCATCKEECCLASISLWSSDMITGLLGPWFFPFDQCCSQYYHSV